MRNLMRHHDREIWKGIAGGLAGGLVASFVMNQFQALWSKMEDSIETAEAAPGAQEGSPDGGAQGHAAARQAGEAERQQEPPADDATVKTANAISTTLLDHPLSDDEKAVAGPAVHYAFGTLMGGLYGAAAEMAQPATALRGMAFGTAVWLAADEAALPALGLAEPPHKVPPTKHAYALASHLVYGLTTDAVRRWVRDLL